MLSYNIFKHIFKSFIFSLLGNVARREFADPQKLAEVLEIDEEFVVSLQTILIFVYHEERLKKKTHKMLPDSVQEILLVLNDNTTPQTNSSVVDPMEEFYENLDSYEAVDISDDEDCDE